MEGDLTTIEYGWMLLDLVPLEPECEDDDSDEADESEGEAEDEDKPRYALRVVGFTADEAEASACVLSVRCAGIGEAKGYVLVGDSIVHGYAVEWRLIWSALIPMADPDKTSRIMQSITIVGLGEIPDWLAEAVLQFVEVPNRDEQPEENEA